MTLQEFKNIASQEKINTNNDWGFGGKIGVKYTLGNMTYFKGKFCYRHTGTSDATKYQINDHEVNKGQFMLSLEVM